MRHTFALGEKMSAAAASRNGIQHTLLWIAIALLGAVSLGVVALSRGETISAAWLVIAAVCVYLVSYRFYALFVAKKVLGIDPSRPTPAYRHNDGLDYVPTNKYVLFGHHFAAIAGAGPLVGPVLAAQMGYLPGTLWILAGAVFAGGMQDMTVMFLSTRRDGRSLGDIVRSEMGPVAGGIALIGVLLIMIILLAVLGHGRGQCPDRQPMGHIRGFRDDPDCAVDGRLFPLRPGWADRRNVGHRHRPAFGGPYLWAGRGGEPGSGAMVHYSAAKR